MTIKELEDKHKYGVLLADKYSYLIEDQINFITNIHREHSIEFAINVLEIINQCLQEDIDEETSTSDWAKGYMQSSSDIIGGLTVKIQELKQQLAK